MKNSRFRNYDATRGALLKKTRMGDVGKKRSAIKTQSIYMFCLLIIFFSVGTVQAAIVVPGANGSDGELRITVDTVIDLAQAVTGTWNDDNSEHAGNGIYDSDKWAVVFKYENVTVDAGATLTFSNHPSRAPVVWLVSGDVSIDGTVSLDGQNWQHAPANSEPGPGGFRGGSGHYSTGVTQGAGLGPGGGGHASGGSYGTEGGRGPAPYGNQSLIPLIGGSGGGGYAYVSGGAGGGAFLLASQNTISINGMLHSNGGTGHAGDNYKTGGGSGGGIRLVAETLSGKGTINALAGAGFRSGGLGRIRLERVTNNNNLIVAPPASLLTLTPDYKATLWSPNEAPTLKIVSICAVFEDSATECNDAPVDPRAAFGTNGADVVLPEITSAQVVIETTNVEEASTVEVRLTPEFNANFVVVPAAVESIISNDPLTIRWTADIDVSTGYSAIQAKVVRP